MSECLYDRGSEQRHGGEQREQEKDWRGGLSGDFTEIVEYSASHHLDHTGNGQV